MSDIADRIAKLSHDQLQLLAMQLSARLEAGRQRNNEPIALVGIGCRFPGNAIDPHSYWRLLRQGDCAITRVPAERWDADAYYDPDPDAPGRTYTNHGAFLSYVDQFDADFFRISPREAAAMDPQHRLLLEVSWEALEHAGQCPDELAGGRSGVFVAVYGNDYAELASSLGDISQIDAYTSTGNAASVASGRISYFLDLRGPSITIDTACSSSLVAVHLACQSLLQGECDLALAGGVNLNLTPTATIALSKLRMLAADGRCKTFDDAADGFVRGEGCGIVVLKRLSDALTDNDRIVALIRSSAINQDGSSGGLTAPNGPSQEALIRRALAEGRIEPSEVDYVEAHGTGTSLGDPVEVQALDAALTKGRSAERPLLIGSVKTNIGHLEAAAGIAGLIKVALAIQHGEIPRHLHLSRPSRYIDWQKMRVAVPTELTPWPSSPDPRIAGVSSFGFSGTNAHVLLQQAPQRPVPELSDDRPLHLLTLSAKTDAALNQLSQRLVRYLQRESEDPLADVCYTANCGRAHFDRRVGVVAGSIDEARRKLLDFGKGASTSGVFRGAVQSDAEPIVTLLFGSQEDSLLRPLADLYRSLPTFARALDQCDEILHRQIGWRITSFIQQQPETGRSDGQVPQRCLVAAFGYAMWTTWKSWGIRPSLVMGDGVGECVAAVAAGALSLVDAFRLLSSEVEVGMSGDKPGLSPPSSPKVPFVSTRNGRVQADQLATVEYWRDCLQASPDDERFVWNPSHPDRHVMIVIGSCSSNMRPTEKTQASVAHWLPGLDDQRDTWSQLLDDVAQLYVAGVDIDWRGFDADYPRCKLVLPGYSFQRSRHWLDLGSRPESTLTVQASGPHSSQDEGPTEESAGVVTEYYDSITELAEMVPQFSDGDLSEEGFLTFAPLPEVVPGFSWFRIAVQPQRHAAHARLALAAQKQMRSVLFRHVDLQRCQTVLDFGCGNGTDLLVLAERYSHLKLCGYTLSEKQADRANRVAASRGLQDRLSVFQRDSAKEPFPDQYDLVIGLEVAAHIKNKQALLENVGRHLTEDGQLLLADFAANMSAIEHDATSSYIARRTDWAELLADQGLLIDQCVDVSREIANYLDDPDFEQNLAETTAVVKDARIRAAVVSHNNLCRMLRNEVVSYLLINARKSCDESVSELRRRNLDRLSAAVPYSQQTGADLCYQTEWHKQSRDKRRSKLAGNGQESDGGWLIFADRQGVAREFKQSLQRNGMRYCTVSFGGEYQEIGHAEIQIDPRESDHFDRLLQQSSGASSTRVVYFAGLDATLPSAGSSGHSKPTLNDNVADVMKLVQALQRQSPSPETSLWLVTQNAAVTGDDAEPLAVAQSPLWGLGSVLSLELPDLWGGIIDLPQEPTAEDLEDLFNAIRRPDDEDHIALRSGDRYVERLVRSRPLQLREWEIRAEATYLITGGLGALGLRVAEWLVRQGARQLLLVGRRGAETPGIGPAIEDLRSSGARIAIVSADVSKSDDLVRLFEDASRNLPPLRGIVHAAGSTLYREIADAQPHDVPEVLAAKVTGAWLLHELTRQCDLDFFVCFSSIASVWGSKGQAHYAAANRFLDGLAHYRHALGLPALTVNWGPWQGGGMATSAARDLLSRIGIGSLEPSRALALLECFLAESVVQRTVCSVDWSVFKSVYEARRSRPLLEPIRPTARSSHRQPAEWSEMLRRLEQAPSEQRHGILETHLRQEVARVLGWPPPKLPEADRGFFDLGMDSLMAVELQTRLQSGLSQPIESTSIFKWSNIRDLTRFLLDDVIFRESKVDATAADPQHAVAEKAITNEIAGMSEEELDTFVRQSLQRF